MYSMKLRLTSISLRGGGILCEVLSFYDRDFQYVQVIVSYVVEVGDVE